MLQKLEVTDQYQYLGLKLRPSGSFNFSVGELYDKASRAWFSISNIVFQNNRMPVDRALGIFDSLVTPVATYGAPCGSHLYYHKKASDVLKTY